MNNKSLTVRMDWNRKIVTLQWVNGEDMSLKNYEVTSTELPLEVLTHMERAQAWGHVVKVRGFV